jgi:hypothetical protein
LIYNGCKSKLIHAQGENMPVRSTVSADISKNTIWINSTDFKSTVRAVKIHEELMTFFGYDDGYMLETSRRGAGVSIAVCNFETVVDMREDYALAKKKEPTITTTDKHIAKAKELLGQLYA